jgi:signal transduction histidine kinase
MRIDPLEVGILVVALLVNFVLLGFVYMRNSKSATHRLFALLTLVMSLWSLANFFAVNAETTSVATWGVRSVMFFATPLSVVFFLLMHTFPRSTTSISRRALWIWAGLTLLTMAVAISPLLFPTVELIPGSAPKPTPGPGMILFVPIGVGTIPLGIYFLIRKIRKAKGIEKVQLNFLALGVVAMFALIIPLNFISVNVFNNSSFNKYGPLFTLPFTLLTTYTIIRHRLMDIRAAIARSLSFSALIASFFALYGVILIFAVEPLANRLGLREGVVAAAGALLSVLLARYFQAFLRRLTDRFLFQRQTDYRAALVTIGQKLSRTIQIEEVTKTVLQALENIVRSRRAIIFLQDPKTAEYQPRAAYGAGRFTTSIPHDNVIVEHLRHAEGAIVNDELALALEQESWSAHKEELEAIRTAMDWLDASAIVPLFVDTGLIGFIALGEKLSGQPYLREDVEFLSALAPQAATALENARLYKESLEFGEKLKIEVKNATQELEIANSQLKDLDKAKSEFLSIASHQLYTPLTALRGYLSMMQEGDFGKLEEKQKPVIDILSKSALRLIELIKNLLDISRIESGRLELNLESIDMAQMAKELVQDLMPNARNKKLDLEFHASGKTLTHVVADSQRIRQVMLNFIDNAIKYTPSGRIDVFVEEKNKEIVFSVTDTGKGVTPQEITKLFTKFTRVGGASRFHTEGTGLGLYVARQIVREHRGEVEVHSEGQGKGSTFIMRLPIEGAAKSLKLGDKATVVIKAADAQGAVVQRA